MSQSTLPGTGPWSWLEPGLWVYRARELDLLGQADGLLADAAPAARQGGAALLEAKRRLHAAGVGAATAPATVGGGGHRFVVQVGIQFLAGYRDLNLRDAAHVGHGAVLCHDPEWHGRRELGAVIRGALVGLAATEQPLVRWSAGPAGGAGADGADAADGADGATGAAADLDAVVTRAVRTAAGWEITGRKAWVSRVLEADAFVVFARSPEHLSAFYVPAGSPGLSATPAARPGDGDGWSWGELSLQRVPVPLTAVLGASVGGVAVFRRHFAEYRPLVAATCLGAAAAAVDGWVERALSGAGSTVADRLPGGVVERLGDLRGRVLVTLGGLFTGAARPGGIDSSWSKMVKAQSVQTAIEVVRSVEHAMLDAGGAPDAATDAVRRARQELSAFEAADGAPASLLRSAGERFVQYSAAILDEISEPTSTMPRPRLPE
jgi:alkylation response protein AidB-like acyl-CoA dehydrogenase